MPGESPADELEHGHLQEVSLVVERRHVNAVAQASAGLAVHESAISRMRKDPHIVLVLVTTTRASTARSRSTRALFMGLTLRSAGARRRFRPQSTRRPDHSWPRSLARPALRWHRDGHQRVDDTTAEHSCSTASLQPMHAPIDWTTTSASTSGRLEPVVHDAN